MSFFIESAYAQAAGAAPAGGGMIQFLLPVLIIVVFYFMLIRPQSKKAKEHRDMIAKLATGDEVVTAGGILGKVVELSDSFVTLEIAPQVQIKVQRFQVGQLMPKGTVKGA
jgi:preprotein translocase subunit YajC